MPETSLPPEDPLPYAPDSVRSVFPAGSCAAVFFVALLLNLAGLWSLPLTDRDEAYYAEVSREMLERGDFLTPHFNGSQWLEKPPLFFWTQAAAFQVLGESEFAARLPSALAGAGTAAVVFCFALSLFGNHRAALRAGLVCALSPLVLAASKLGMTDMPAVFFTTLSTWAGWELLSSKRGRAVWWWLFYGGAGLGILAKGPVGLLPLVAAGIFVAWERPSGALTKLRPVLGFAVAVGIAACWYGPVFLASEGALASDFFFVHVVQRVLSPSNGHGLRGFLGYLALLPLYFVVAIPAFFPWTLWIPRAGRALRRAPGASGRYLLSGIFLIFAAFSLASTKLPFYILPAFPLMACVVGPVIAPRAFRISASIMAAVTLVVSMGVFPLVGGYLPARALVAGQAISKDARLAIVGNIEPGFIWYLRQNRNGLVQRIEEAGLPAFLATGGDTAIVFVSKSPVPLPEGFSTHSLSGLNLAKGRWENYTLARSPSPPAPQPSDDAAKAEGRTGPHDEIPR